MIPASRRERADEPSLLSGGIDRAPTIQYRVAFNLDKKIRLRQGSHNHSRSGWITHVAKILPVNFVHYLNVLAPCKKNIHFDDPIPASTDENKYPRDVVHHLTHLRRKVFTLEFTVRIESWYPRYAHQLPRSGGWCQGDVAHVKVRRADVLDPGHLIASLTLSFGVALTLA